MANGTLQGQVLDHALDDACGRAFAGGNALPWSQPGGHSRKRWRTLPSTVHRLPAQARQHRDPSVFAHRWASPRCGAELFWMPSQHP